MRAVEASASARAAARRFAASPSAAAKIVRRARGTGSTAPAQIGGHREPLLAGHERLLRGLSQAKPGITLAVVRGALVERGVGPVSVAAAWAALRRLGPTHKERRSLRATEQDRPDVAACRRLWRT